MNEHGYCPHCGNDMDGGWIWETGYEFARKKGLTINESIVDADRYASCYGANREKGKWGREIGQYDMEKDRTVSYVCPDCNGRWRCG